MKLQLAAPKELTPIQPGSLKELGINTDHVWWPFPTNIDSTTEDILAPLVNTIRTAKPKTTHIRFTPFRTLVLPNSSQQKPDWHFDSGHGLIANDRLPMEYALGTMPTKPVGRLASRILEGGDYSQYDTEQAIRLYDGLDEESLALQGLAVRTIAPDTLNAISSNVLHRSPVNHTPEPIDRSSLLAAAYTGKLHK